MTRLASDLLELIELLMPGQLTLVGYSMGSHVIYEYVKLFGDAELDKVVITVMSPTLVNEERPELSLGGGLTGRMALERLSSNNRHYVEGCETAYLTYIKTHAPNEKLREYYIQAARLNSGAMVRLAIAMYAADYWDVLPTFTRPTLILSAEQDMYPRVCHEEQARQIPNSKVVILEGCGHMLVMEKPEAYCEALAEFIQ